MEELEFINKYLGGHKSTIAGLSRLLKSQPLARNRELVICEIGCGGGDNMISIQNWCIKRNISVRFIGIDINPFCIEVATAKLAGLNATLLMKDYTTVGFEDGKPDYIFSSLFCHHFMDEDLVRMLEWIKQHARRGFFINDLHRNILAYYSIKILTNLFSRSYLVKNDAPLSVLRGFSREEWTTLLEKAGVGNYMIEWKWAFRHLITVPDQRSILQ